MKKITEKTLKKNQINSSVVEQLLSNLPVQEQLIDSTCYQFKSTTYYWTAPLHTRLGIGFKG